MQELWRVSTLSAGSWTYDLLPDCSSITVQKINIFFFQVINPAISQTDLAGTNPGKFPADLDAFDYENLDEKTGIKPEGPNHPDDHLDSTKSGKNDYYEGILFSDGLPKPGRRKQLYVT